MKPFGFLDYIKLQQNALCVLSDSGSLTEESSILNFSSLQLREINERPEGLEECPTLLVGLNVERVMQALEIIIYQKNNLTKKIKIIKDYDVENVSFKIIKIIESYTDYINKVVWRNHN